MRSMRSSGAPRDTSHYTTRSRDWISAVSETVCPFCAPAADRIFYAGPLTFGLWDTFPASPGHVLLVPKRHVASWFEATLEEQADLIAAYPETFSVAKYVGRHGWVTVNLASVDPDLMQRLIINAWKQTAPKRLVAASRPNDRLISSDT